MSAALFLSILPGAPISAKEEGSDKSTAQVMESGKEYEEMADRNETSWFKYKVEQTGYIEFNLKEKAPNENGTYSSWRITASIGSAKLLNEVPTGPKFRSPKLGVKKGTTLYIQIQGTADGCKYAPFLLSVKSTKSSVWESELNGTKKKANPVKVNKKYYGNSYYGYPAATAEKDFFK